MLKETCQGVYYPADAIFNVFDDKYNCSILLTDLDYILFEIEPNPKDIPKIDYRKEAPEYFVFPDPNSFKFTELVLFKDKIYSCIYLKDKFKNLPLYEILRNHSDEIDDCEIDYLNSIDNEK